MHVVTTVLIISYDEEKDY